MVEASDSIDLAAVTLFLSHRVDPAMGQKFMK